MNNCAISTWILRDTPFSQSLNLLSESGFSKIELSGSGSDLMRAWEENRFSALKAINSAGLQISSLHCTREGRLNLCSINEEDRLACVAKNTTHLNFMKDCGIPEMVLHPGPAAFPEGSAGRCRMLLRDSLCRLGVHAGNSGLRIAVENSQIPGPKASIAWLLELSEGMGEHVGICHDIGHSFLAGLDPAEELGTALESGRLFSLHIHDVNSEGADHLPPGDGEMDIGALSAMLEQSGFSGLLTFEIRPSRSDIRKTLARAAAVKDSMVNRGF